MLYYHYHHHHHHFSRRYCNNKIIFFIITHYFVSCSWWIMKHSLHIEHVCCFGDHWNIVVWFSIILSLNLTVFEGGSCIFVRSHWFIIINFMLIRFEKMSIFKIKGNFKCFATSKNNFLSHYNCPKQVGQWNINVFRFLNVYKKERQMCAYWP